MRRVTVAVDGPCGSGKSTLGRMLSERLGYLYIDTGAMYRAAALAAIRKGVSLDDGDGLTALASTLSLEFQAQEGGQHLFLVGEDVSAAIRTPEVADGASRVSAVSGVRRVMVRLQQEMGRGGGVVMDGRDIGTVVFPFAEAKIYLDASPEERARRRNLENRERGMIEPMEETLRQVQERDHRDMTRQDSPLRQAEDAVRIDTTGLTVEQVLCAMVEVVERASS